MIDNDTSHIDNSSSSYDGCKNDEQIIKGIMVDLRALIDQLSLDFANARNLIQELARRLDESKQCEQGQICKRIKEILEDKIQERKITDKWIEECLPKEYKRKYVKSELSSLSKDSPETILVSSQGKTITEPKAEPANDSLHIRNLSTCHNCEILQTENIELRQALEGKSQPIMADKLLTDGEREFIILKDKHKPEILNAFRKCKNVCKLIFNSDGILTRIEPDTLQESEEEDGI